MSSALPAAELEALRCPVCNARCKPDPVCSRCGVDQAPWRAVLVKAWELRTEGWRVLLDGDASRAGELATQSLRLHRTASARALEWVAAAVEGIAARA